MKTNKISYLVATLILFVPTISYGAMSSASYNIVADSISVGGGLSTSTTSYTMQDTVGGVAVGISASSSYQINAGYQAQDNSALSFDINSNSIDLGTLANGQLATANITATVSASGGYVLSISGVSGDALPDVVDGVVDGSSTAGEYGLAVSGPSAAFVNDAAVSNTLMLASKPTAAIAEITTLTFKAERGSASTVKQYSQDIVLTASAGI